MHCFIAFGIVVYLLVKGRVVNRIDSAALQCTRPHDDGDDGYGHNNARIVDGGLIKHILVLYGNTRDNPRMDNVFDMCIRACVS
ncbi:hypothetical protein BDF22DRAFT_668122 [Syncephalis plumigaleata]|nr:hypothetical protein BDF22DRAFT_668122 [Syncephalis plumigaleata]